MELFRFSQYWDDISLALSALQDTKVNKKRLKTTTHLQNFAIDINKDTVQARLLKTSYRTAEAFLRFANNQLRLLKDSAAQNAGKV
jgi:hypothetical protein